MINQIHGRPIVMFYPPFGGAKFITNCLALSKYCVHIDRGAMQHLMQNPSDYKYRQQLSLSTIPQGSEIESARLGATWRDQYELNDSSIFGRSGLEPGKTYDWWLVQQVLRQQLDFFLIAHWLPRLQELLSYFPQSRIVRLVNFEKFWNIAQKFKACVELNPPWHECIVHNDQSRVYQQLQGPDWPSWELFESYGYDIVELSRYHPVDQPIVEEIKSFYPWYQLAQPLTVFDVDNTIFFRQKFIYKMYDLYQWLCYNDFDPKTIGIMWDRYAEFHDF
jgi:hypothetical protein